MCLAGRRRRTGFSFSAFWMIFSSALIYVLFFTVGYIAYPPLSDLLDAKFSSLADPFLEAMALPRTDFSLLISHTLCAARHEILLVLLLFLFTFTFFQRQLTTILSCLYALSLGMAMGRLSLAIHRVISPFAFYAFLVIKAILSAFILLYMQRASLLSDHLRYLPRRGMKEAWSAIALHFFLGLALAFAVFAAAFAEIFLIR